MAVRPPRGGRRCIPISILLLLAVAYVGCSRPGPSVSWPDAASADTGEFEVVLPAQAQPASQMPAVTASDASEIIVQSPGDAAADTASSKDQKQQHKSSGGTKGGDSHEAAAPPPSAHANKHVGASPAPAHTHGKPAPPAHHKGGKDHHKKGEKEEGEEQEGEDGDEQEQEPSSSPKQTKADKQRAKRAKKQEKEQEKKKEKQDKEEEDKEEEEAEEEAGAEGGGEDEEHDASGSSHGKGKGKGSSSGDKKRRGARKSGSSHKKHEHTKHEEDEEGASDDDDDEGSSSSSSSSSGGSSSGGSGGSSPKHSKSSKARARHTKGGSKRKHATHSGDDAHDGEESHSSHAKRAKHHHGTPAAPRPRYPQQPLDDEEGEEFTSSRGNGNGNNGNGNGNNGNGNGNNGNSNGNNGNGNNGNASSGGNGNASSGGGGGGGGGNASSGGGGSGSSSSGGGYGGSSGGSSSGEGEGEEGSGSGKGHAKSRKHHKGAGSSKSSGDEEGPEHHEASSGDSKAQNKKGDRAGRRQQKQAKHEAKMEEQAKHKHKHGHKHPAADDEHSPVPQPPRRFAKPGPPCIFRAFALLYTCPPLLRRIRLLRPLCAVLAGSGTFVWATLAAENQGKYPTGLGEVPYFPTLRGPWPADSSHHGHKHHDHKKQHGHHGAHGSTHIASAVDSGADEAEYEDISLYSEEEEELLEVAVSGSSQASVSGGAQCGVTTPAFALKTNAKGANQCPGFFGTSDPDQESSPTDEAIMVGPVEAGAGARGRRYVVHAVNRVAEVFVAYANGTLCPHSLGFTRVSLKDMMGVTGCPSVSRLVASEPSAYYDHAARRYVLVWIATAPAFDAEPLLFVAVSQSSDPLGAWSVRALKVKPDPSVFSCPAPGMRCTDPEPFFATYPQVTYTNDGLYVTLGLVCSGTDGNGRIMAAGANFRSALFAYSKAALYAHVTASSGTGSGTGSGSTGTVYAALWIVEKAWYRSVPPASSGMLPASLNNYVQPVRPQSLEDVFNGPYFVQKVDNAHMSMGALVSTSRLSAMTSVETAPRLVANVFARGMDFGNCDGAFEGANVMAQPETDVQLFAGDTGLVGRGYAVRSYGAVLFHGSVYLTTSEFYGAGRARTPAIYWAILDPGSPQLATGALAVSASGVIASSEGLALGFPVIAALSSEDGAVVAYAYGKAGELHPGCAGYAGVATTTIRNAGMADATIDIVKTGEGSITAPPHDSMHVQRWGDYSACDVSEGAMWFAVPTTRLVGGKDPMVDASYASWISVKSLE